MLGFYFNSFSFLFLFFIILYNNWTFYFLSLNYSLSKFCSKQKKLISNVKQIYHKNLSLTFFNFFFLTFFFLILFLFFFKGYQSLFFFNSVFLNNKSLNFLFLYFFIFFLFFLFKTFFIKTFFFNNSLDFLISFIFLFFFSTFIFFSNNLFTFFFCLELIAITNFYLISASKEFFFFNQNKNSNYSLKSKSKKTFFNVLFFNFWSSFFSSMFLLYSILNIYFIFGTTEWTSLNFLLSTGLDSEYFYNKNNIFFTFFIFFLACVFKLGLPPFFFFKIEIYKGLPLFITFFYSTFFFLSYVSSFYFLFFIFFTNFFIYFSFYFLLFIPFFVVFFFYYLTTYDNLNCFFSISSVINSVFLIYLLSSIAI